jgi:hypothetical protein
MEDAFESLMRGNPDAVKAVLSTVAWRSPPTSRR